MGLVVASSDGAVASAVGIADVLAIAELARASRSRGDSLRRHSP